MDINGKVHCFFEQWKDIEGYEGHYQVSNLGRVKSLQRVVKSKSKGTRLVKERILSAAINKNGYYCVVLSILGKRKNMSVHRLVATTFIQNPLGFNEINHKDENKLNNNANNLEWCDRVYNANYGTGVNRCSQKKWKPVAMINKDTKQVERTFRSAREASSNTGIDFRRISSVCNNKRKSAGGYIWKFVE